MVVIFEAGVLALCPGHPKSGTAEMTGTHLPCSALVEVGLHELPPLSGAAPSSLPLPPGELGLQA